MRLLALALACFFAMALFGQEKEKPRVLVFWEEGFPAVDTAQPDRAALAAIPGAAFASSADLPTVLGMPGVGLLVMPYGSAFPESAWPAIQGYLQRGGNLLAIGGRPFSQAAYDECHSGVCAWKLRYPRNAWAKALFINDYAETPGSEGSRWLANDDFPEIAVPAFAYERSWSAIVRLSSASLDERIGSAGEIDARLDPLAWGTRDGQKLSAPVIEIDHLMNNFDGGRWVLVPAELAQPLPSNVVTLLAARAMQGARDFVVQPDWALFLPGETPGFTVHGKGTQGSRLEITDEVESGDADLLGIEITNAAQSSETRAPQRRKTPQGSANVQKFALTALSQHIELATPSHGGLHTVTARVYDGSQLVAQYRTGYWVRDEKLLNSGPQVTVGKDFFLIDGKPQPIVGTTYMASDVQRQYLMQPNPFVWNRDFAQMHSAGINMVRTGLWSAWDQLTREPGLFQEGALRNLEAFLMTARRYNIPVQFTFFAFIPDTFGGANPYLDPEAIRRQQQYIGGIVSRFKSVPWLMYDLINEPSFDNPKRLWVTRPNGDAFESRLWNEYLMRVHGDVGAVGNAWNMAGLSAPIPVPREEDFAAGSVYRGGHPLSAHDFYLFAQKEFVVWANKMRATIRATGSTQLITVGQDEGGGTDRLSPSYWVDAVDFTTNHTWWLNDALLWDSLIAKQPGKPALIQETGLQNDFQLDDTWRRSVNNQAWLLERKGALALATTAGVIDWLWNVNAYMTEDVEVTIGIVRADATEKPETSVMRGLAGFANTNRAAFHDPQPPQVAIVLPQDLQYSPLNTSSVRAQQAAVRVLHNYLHTPAYAVAENRLSEMGSPKLAILPSPMVLSDTAWKQLTGYVSQGGTLLITGSFDRDPWWRYTARLKALGVDAKVEPLNFPQGAIAVDGKTVQVSFGDHAWLDQLRFGDGATWKEVSIGKGKLLLTSFPVELSDGYEATAAVYAAALQRAGVEAPFEANQLSPGVLVRPVVFADTILYAFMSETGRAEAIDVRDKLTGAKIQFTLPEQRAALVLLNKSDGHIVAKYGF